MKLKRYVQRMGSKNWIAFELFDKITELVPNHKELTFIDLFWWWWAMSSNSTYFFKNTIYNEIDKWVSDLFVAVQDDSFIKKLKDRWVNREEFLKIKNKENRTTEEDMLLTTFSFWNNRQNYMYGKKIEEKKYLTHMIINSKTEEEYKWYIKQYNDNKAGHFEKYWAIWDCFLYDNDWEEFNKADKKRYYKFWAKSIYYRKFYQEFDMDLFIEKRWEFKHKKDVKLLSDLQRLESLQRLEHLERLEKLEKLESLESLARLENLERLESLSSLEHLESLQSLERLENLQSLQSLERLESLQSLQSLEIYNKSYEDIVLPEPSECIIYLDPPYRWTRGYW